MLRLRGIAFEANGKQLGMTKQAAHLLYKKALKLTPKADVEEMRKLEAEPIADLRQRLWSRLAGRPDPNDPTKTIPPTNDELVALVGQVIRLTQHGLRARCAEQNGSRCGAHGFPGRQGRDRHPVG